MDTRTLAVGVVAVLFFLISFKGCFNGENNNNQNRSSQRVEQISYEKSPVDELIRDMSQEQNFSIILYDMDYSEATNKYKHQYNVLIERTDTILTENTGWMAVSAAFFQQNVDNMGMEIASKKDGKVSKSAAPAGYTNYIGNEKYGEWRKDNQGNTFWEFYGKYAFLSSMFRMAMFPVRYSMWNDYHSNYYRYGRNYYGPSNNGRRTYGTSSNYAKANTKSSWNNKSSNFKSSVRNKVQPSSARSTSTKSSSTKKRTNYTKTTRSSSRYNSSSSYRSRGGSYGK